MGIILALKPHQYWRFSYQFESVFTDLAPARTHIQRHHLVRQQPLQRLLAEPRAVHLRPQGKALLGADVVQAREVASDPFQHLGVVQFGRAPAAAWADAEGKAIGVVQAGTLQLQGCDDADLGAGQGGSKVMLLLDLGVAPAPGTVELGHHRAAVFELHLVDPVLVRGQGRQPTIAAQANAL